MDDLAGNSFAGITNETDFNFTSADETAPTFVDATFYDTNGNGSIDEILLEFSEDIDESSVDDADFNIGGAGLGVETFTVTAGASAANGVDTNDTDVYVTLAVNITGTTVQTIVYTQNDDATDVADDAGNQALNNAGLTTIDLAAPVIISAVTGDVGGVAGQIDQIVVTFSEDIEAGDVDEVPTVVAGDDFTDDFTITGYDISGVLPSGGSGVDGNQLIISLTESGGGDTGVTPNVTLNATQLNDLATVPNAATAYSAAATDGADPVLLSSSPSDNDIDIALGANVVLTFSENVVAGTGNVDIVDIVLTDDRTIAIGSTTILTNQVTIDPGADLSNLRDYAVQIDATALDDGAGNSYAGIADNTTLNFTTIGATPTFDVTWLDNSGDGNIDQMRLDFSAAVSFTDGNGVGQVFEAIAISGGVINITDNIDFSTISGVSFYVFNITGATGTSSPAVTVTYNRGTNNTIVADVGGQEIADLDNPGTVTDGAAPVFIDATFYDVTAQDGVVDEILLEFSEDIDETTVDDADFNIGGAGLGTETFTVTAGASVNNGVDTNDTDVYVTLAVSLNTTDDRTIVYTQNDDASDVADATGNQAVNDVGLTTIDLAAPVLTDLRIEDTDNDGTIDQMTYVFSEIVFDVVGGVLDDDIGTLTMPDASTFDGGGGNALGDANVSLTNDGTYGLLVMDVAAAGYSTVGTAAGSSDVTGAASNFEDDQAQAGVEITEAIVDLAKPRIMSVTITGNSTADIVFSEGVWGNSANSIPVDEPNFNFNFQSGALTGPTVVEVNSTATGEPGLGSDNLVGGETDIRIFFSYTGSAVGGETTQWNTNGSIYDNANNTADATQYPTDNEANLAPPAIPDMSIAEWLDQDGDGQIDAVAISFNVDWDIDEFSGSDGADGLDCIAITNGATPVTQDNEDYDSSPFPTNGFFNAGQTVTITFAGDQQPGTSIANLQVTYQTGATDRIESQATEDDAVPGDTPDQHFDMAAPRFVNYTATILDSDEDGNVDRIQVDAQDNIDDSAIDPSEFTYNGLAATGVVNVDNTDQSFTLTVNGNGTAVEGDFVYTPGVSLVDTAANASDGGTIVAASVTDAAAPAILSAITADNDLNGQIDEITITFSENIQSSSLDVTGSTSADFDDFDDDGTYDITTVTDGTADDDEVTLTISESGSSDTFVTPDVILINGQITDAEPNSITVNQTFSNTSDGAAPYSTVDPLTTSDASPPLTGTIDDTNATVLINLDGSTVSATNNSDGTWTLPDNSITVSGIGTFEVTAIGIDIFGNNATDVTSNELTINGGANITNATLINICAADGYQPLGDIQITETGNGDFSSTGTILLTLPAGFEFNTAAPISNGGGSNFVDITVTYTFVGTATLRLNITYDGVDDGLDDVIIQGLEVQAVTGGASGNLERAGGTASLLTTDTNYATLSSNAAPADLTDLEDAADPGTPITSYTARFLPRVTINYTAGPVFTNGEDFVFAGGATGTMVTGTDVSSSFDMYLTSGTVAASETFTGQTSAQVGTTTSAAIGVSDILLPFTLDANPTATANWYDGTGGLINSLASNNNTALSATTPGLYTYDITDDNATCESSPLRFNVLVYDDVHPDNNESTFQDKTYTVTDDRDTIYISNPTGHTVSVTGNGISVVGGGADPLLAIFDPEIAGDNGAGGPQTHIITYSITNGTTGESTSETVTFTVEPETAIWAGPPADEYCADDAITVFDLNTTGFNNFGGPFPYINRIGIAGLRFLNYSTTLDGGVLETGGIYGPGSNQYNWDPTLFLVPDGDYENVEVVREIFDNAGIRRVDAENYFIIYGNPFVSLTNVSASYCEDDAAFTLNRTTSFVSAIDDSDPRDPIPTYGGETNQSITNGYELYRFDGFSYVLYEDFTAGGIGPINTFDPTDPNQNSTVDANDVGQFRITYYTETLTPNSCIGQVDVFVTINPDTPTPVLDAATISGGGAVGFVDNVTPQAGVEDNEYLLEYCVGQVAGNFVTSDANTVRWYDDGFNNIPAFNGMTSIPPAAVGLSVSAGAFNAEQSVVFYFTSTDAFGCESDYRLVSVEVYPLSDAPVVDTGDWPSSVTSGNEVILDFCIPQGGDIIPSNTSTPNVLVFDPLAADETYTVRAWYQGVNTNFDGYLKYIEFSGAVGTFQLGERVTGGTSGSFGYVQEIGSGLLAIRQFDISDPTTDFNIGETFSGLLSGATATVDNYSETRVYTSENIPTHTLRHFEFASVSSNVGFISGENISAPSGATGRIYYLYNTNFLFFFKTNAVPFVIGEVVTGATSGASSSITGYTTDRIPFYRYDVTKTSNINASSSFAGCEGPFTQIFTHGQFQPTDPTIADLQAGMTNFHVSEGDNLSDIIHTNVGMDGYAWYENSNKTNLIGTDTIASGAAMTEAILGAVGFDPSSVADVTPPLSNDVYTYYFSRIDRAQASREFDGCESNGTIPVTITVHAIQPAPGIVSDNSASSINTTAFTDLNDPTIVDPAVDYYYSICTDRLEAVNLLVASEATYPGASRTFKWYSHDGASTRGTEFTTDGSGTASLAELQLTALSGITSPTNRYFEVVQVTDNDVYAGVESQSVLVRVQVSPQDALEFRDNLAATIPNEFCRDDAVGNVIVDLYAGGSSAGSGNVNYEIDSYTESNYNLSSIRTATIDHTASALYTVGETVTGGTSGATAEVVTDDGATMTVTNMSGTFQVGEALTGASSAIVSTTTTFSETTPGPDVDGAVTPGNPTLDIDALHDAVPGTGTVAGVGGESTVHVITMTYLDPTTLCEGSATKTITINPDPDITFFVNGLDIASFVAGDDQFCYEDGGITLQGALADGTPLTTGSFNSAELGGLATSNGASSFNTINEHNSFHGVTGTNGKFLNQSDILITYNYTDGNGCDNSISTTLYVNPEPEVIEVTGLLTSDLAQANSTNFIRITDFCEGSSAVTAEIKFVDPSDPDPGSVEEGDYSGYSFAWTIGGSTVTDLNIDGLDNTIEFVPPSNTMNFSVTVTDLNGCTETYSESHTLQDLPDLDITGVTNNQEFCADDTDPTIGLDDAEVDGDGATNTVNISNVVSWSVDSYNENDGVGSAVQIASGTGSLPTIDLDAWHTDALLTTPGTLVGGASTVHTITVVYQDPSREYQGVTTLCTNTAVETIVINPDPDISIEVAGIDIASFVAGDDEFCYEDGNVVLQGTLSDGTPLTSGTFSSSVTGVITTNNGVAIFNPLDQHNAFHGVTGTNGKFLNQSNITVTYDYTDANGCDNSVNTTLYVNPEPEVIEVTGLPTSDLAQSKPTNYIRVTDFCNGSTAVTAEIKFIDPLDADPGSVEEDDYSAYTFSWTVGGSAITDLDLDGLDNTIEFVPPSNTMNFSVTVTDLNGCSEIFNEAHTLQTLPSLDITGITNNQAFCADNATDPTIGLSDAAVNGDGATNTVNALNVTSWSVDSYSDDNATPVQIASGTGGLPVVDLDSWHTDVNLLAPGSLVGGPSTYHTITINYQDPSREYQGIATMCSNTVVETIVIHPDPDISFEVGGSDIASFVVGDDQFCYEDGNITLSGILSDGTPLTGGAFSSSETGVITTNNGVATFNTQNQHNAFHGVTGTDGKFLNQSTITVTYNYTDGNGCDNSVSVNLFINPEPEVIPVTGLPSSDLAATRPTNRIRMTNFCIDASTVDAEIQFIDPTDPDPGSVEEDDYSGYSFEWTINGDPTPDTDTNGLPDPQVGVNTLNFIPPSTTLNINVVVTDLNGCSESYTETHQMQSLPNLDITGVTNNQEYCVDETDPSIGLSDSRVDGDGATNTVNAVDVLSWSVDSYSDDDATPVQIASGTGSLPVVDLDAWHTDTNLLAPGSLVGGPATYHTITIDYQDPSREYQGTSTLCSNSVSETIVVNPDPDITFTLNGVDSNNLQFCYDDAGIILKGISAEDGSALGGSFNVNGSLVSTNNGEAVIDADTYHGTDPFAVQSIHTVTYSFTDNNGCDRTVTKDFLVNPRPRFVDNEIKTASTCATSNIVVFADMVVNELGQDDEGYEFTWLVNGDTVQVLNGDVGGDTLSYDMDGATTANFSVIVTYIGTGNAAVDFTTGCSSSINNQSITVGQEPIPAIVWAGITADHPDGTDFVITEDNATLPDADVTEMELVIDGTSVLTVPNPTFPYSFNFDNTHPDYSFDVSGRHSIALTMNTVANCGVTLSRTLDILPHYVSYGSNNSYIEDFEDPASFELDATSEDGGWYVEVRTLDGKYDTLSESWERNTSIPGTTIQENGNVAVYTEGYKDSEVSFVYSPSFDLSGFQAPTVSLLRYKDFDSFRDGAVLQISYDDGRNWETVGTYDESLADIGLSSTPGWYDREAITAAPGTHAIAFEVADNNEGFGWAVNDETDMWLKAISPVPASGPYVRFRIALAAQAGTKESNGFGFDLFEIYDRDQIVLVEMFSSSLNAQSLAFNDSIDNNTNFSGSDLLIINYFTDFANGATIDQINKRNTKDPGAKSSFYGISDIPSIAIGGKAQLVEDVANSGTELVARLDNAKLSDPGFDISITEASVTDNELTINANFVATSTYNPGTKIGLFTAIVEPQISVGSLTLNNVLRKMLPDAAGQFFQLTDTLQPTGTLNYDEQVWTINNMMTPENFRVVVYAQNLKTKEVYQAKDTLITGAANVLGLGNELEDFSLYPNPADKEVTVEFVNPLSEETDWIIYDQAGREVLKGAMNIGTKTMTVQTTDLPSGLYFIHLYGEDAKRQSKRVIVLH
ncbi:MAG: Ig-like domain-containing protein [Ekhidna sp.]|uniref:Ig-like domain-containing protein n=1 Tax=Ekhidna sp. TaxID=2608089 RepID=UPI003298EC42